MKSQTINKLVFFMTIFLDLNSSFKIKEKTYYLDKTEYNIDDLPSITNSVMNNILILKSRKNSNSKVKNYLITESNEKVFNEKTCNNHEETINICNDDKCIQKIINIDGEAVDLGNQNENDLNEKKEQKASRRNHKKKIYFTEQEDNELGDDKDKKKNDDSNSTNQKNNLNSSHNYSNKTNNNENSLQNGIRSKTDKNNTNNKIKNSLGGYLCNNNNSLSKLKTRKNSDELKKLKMILENPNFNTLINALSKQNSNNQNKEGPNIIENMNQSVPININIPTSNLAINKGNNPISQINSDSTNENKIMSHNTERAIKSTTNIIIEIG